MSLGKAFLGILLVGGVGFIGWTWHSDGYPPWESGTRSSLRDGVEDASAMLLIPLTDSAVDTNPRLRRLWDQAKNEYRSGRLSRAEADIYAELIRELRRLEKERQTYRARYRDVMNRDSDRFGLGGKDERNRQVILQQMRREWSNARGQGRARVRDLLARLDARG